MNILHTPDLTLLPQTAAHAPAMFDVLSDPAIYTYENAPPPRSTRCASASPGSNHAARPTLASAG